jgi:hypothetical protein
VPCAERGQFESSIVKWRATYGSAAWRSLRPQTTHDFARFHCDLLAAIEPPEGSTNRAESEGSPARGPIFHRRPWVKFSLKNSKAHGAVKKWGRGWETCMNRSPLRGVGYPGLFSGASLSRQPRRRAASPGRALRSHPSQQLSPSARSSPIRLPKILIFVSRITLAPHAGRPSGYRGGAP